jgi:hypothetical protein
MGVGFGLDDRMSKIDKVIKPARHTRPVVQGGASDP